MSSSTEHHNDIVHHPRAGDLAQHIPPAVSITDILPTIETPFSVFHLRGQFGDLREQIFHQQPVGRSLHRMPSVDDYESEAVELLDAVFDGPLTQTEIARLEVLRRTYREWRRMYRMDVPQVTGHRRRSL